MKQFLCAAVLSPAVVFAAGTWNVRDFGAKGDGETKDTVALQRALDACAQAGGGRVCVPAGTFLTGSIFLGDNTELCLDKDAVILGSPDLRDYNADDAYPQNYGSKYEGWSAKHLILAIERKNVALTGEGTVDGNAASFFATRPKWRMQQFWRDGAINARDYEHQGRPGQEIVFVECRNVRVEGVTFRDMSCWNCLLWGCDDVRVRDITVRNNFLYLNTDAFDIDSCRNVLVTGCDVMTGDDGFAVRASPHRLRNKDRVCENVTISNCTVHCQADGVRVGVGRGEIRNLKVFGLDVIHAGMGLEIHGAYGDGHDDGVNVKNALFENIRIRNCATAISVMAGGPHAKVSLSDIAFRGIDAEAEGPDPVVVSGNTHSRPTRVSFSDVRLKVVPPTGYARKPSDLPAGGKKRSAVSVTSADGVSFSNAVLSWRLAAIPFWGRGFMSDDVRELTVGETCRFPDPLPAHADRPYAGGACAF